MGRSLAWVGLCASAWACGPGHVEPSPWDRFELAYVASSGVDGAQRIVLSDAAGAEQVELVTQAVASEGIAWAPDGDRLAYLTALEVRPDGAVVRWGVRGVGVDEDAELAQIDRTLLGGFSGSSSPSAIVISWSPAGDHVAVTMPGRSEAAQCNTVGMELWLVALDEVDDVDDPAARRIGTDVDTVAASWTADGRGLAYGARYLVCGDEGQLADFGWNVHARSVDPDWAGGTVADVFEFDEWGPAWSPRGEAVAYSAGDRDPLAPTSRIDVVDGIGEPGRVVIEGVACGLEVGGWFPDGERLLVRRVCADGVAHVVVDAVRGTVEAELPDLGAVVAVAPDGGRVAYVEDGEVAVFELAEGRSGTIGAGSGPAWRPR